jgi:hypothetical protein
VLPYILVVQFKAYLQVPEPPIYVKMLGLAVLSVLTVGTNFETMRRRVSTDRALTTS